MWQVLVPMISDQRARLGDGRGRDGDMGVDVRDRHGRAGLEARPAAARSLSPPARLPSGRDTRRHLLVDDVLEAAGRAPRSRRSTGNPSCFDHIAL